MKYQKATCLIAVIVFTASFANADPTQKMTDTDIQRLLKQIDLSKPDVAQVNLDSQDNRCLLPDYLWRVTAGPHLDYCQSKGCTTVLRKSANCG